MPNEPQQPRPLSLVRFRFEACPVEFHSKYPFTQQRVYLFLGEIANMPGHCVVCDHPFGQIYSGFHTENFVEVEESN
jgi:hypothetical protein